MGSIEVRNLPSWFGTGPAGIDFDLKKVNLSYNYNIIIHRVYDPFNNFDTEFEYFNDPNFDTNTLILLWHPVEIGAWMQEWINRFNYYVVHRNFKIVYITGCTTRLDLDKHFDIKFKYTFMPCFDIRAANQWKCQPAEITIDKPKKFLCLNAKDVTHRRYTLYQLYSNNLIGDGIVSYSCTNGIQAPYSQYPDTHIGAWFTQEQIDNIIKIKELSAGLLPIYLDQQNWANALAREVFTDSYINIVNETDFINRPYGYRASFVTEKTFNAIANNQMFIVVGQPHSLELLQDLGYKTFNGIIDESYDKIAHNGDRLETVGKIIVDFLKRPIEKIREDYIRALPIIEHNRNLIYSQCHDLDKRLQDIVNRYG